MRDFTLPSVYFIYIYLFLRLVYLLARRPFLFFLQKKNPAIKRNSSRIFCMKIEFHPYFDSSIIKFKLQSHLLVKVYR